MNRKGFTLIELLAVIILIGMIAVIITPGVLDNVNTAKESSYNTLIKNIVTSAELYYEECEYGDLSDTTKYGSYACKINNKTITTKLSNLANTGFLKTSDTKLENGNEIKIVLNPKNDKDISSCKIKITKEISASYKVTYKIENNDTRTICPNTYK